MHVRSPRKTATPTWRQLHLHRDSYTYIETAYAIEYLFVLFQLDIFRAYTPIFRSNGCYNFFTYVAYGDTALWAEVIVA